MKVTGKVLYMTFIQDWNSRLETSSVEYNLNVLNVEILLYITSTVKF